MTSVSLGYNIYREQQQLRVVQILICSLPEETHTEQIVLLIMRSAAFYLSGLIKPACCEDHFEASSNIFKSNEERSVPSSTLWKKQKEKCSEEEQATQFLDSW